MYKRTRQGWQKHVDFILLDILCGQIALALAYSLRFEAFKLVYSEEIYRSLAVWMALFSLLAAILFNTMHDVLKRGKLSELRQTMTQCLLVFGAIVIFLFSLKDAEKYSRIVLWLTLIFYILLSYSARVVWKSLVRRRLRREKARAMLLITDEGTAPSIIRRFGEDSLDGIDLCGVVLVDRDGTGESIEGIPVVANLESAAKYICREWIDEVFIGVGEAALVPNDLIDKCREMGVTLHLQMMSYSSGKQFVEKIAGIPVITNSINIASPLQLMLKRMIDILGGLALSLAAALAILIVGPVIKRKSPGPILYRQERVGRNGKRFRMYKIRSMCMDADARKQELMSQNRVADGMMFKMDFDPRIIGNEILADGTQKTGIGEFIRRTSIDELPQGFNVLMNQMSLVGTRPPTVDEWEKYELHHRARLSAKPGITGMWQVSGRSEITNFEEVTRLDTEYIENWSIGLDIKILMKTVGAVLGHKGAI